jgi:tellurium resistance protein TerD
MPILHNPLRKGQKTALDPQRKVHKVKVCFGWKVTDGRCDVDASAFLVNEQGKVPNDSWFVFYGQTKSPDESVRFSKDRTGREQEIIDVDFDRLHPGIQKIVFVITINEAFEHQLNFSMMRDTYIRLVDSSTNQEIVSYLLDEYYGNVTSMTMGELYLHNGQWKFNPVGNGVRQDLAGQCAIYGVEIG